MGPIWRDATSSRWRVNEAKSQNISKTHTSGDISWPKMPSPPLDRYSRSNSRCAFKMKSGTRGRILYKNASHSASRLARYSASRWFLSARASFALGPQTKNHSSTNATSRKRIRTEPSFMRNPHHRLNVAHAVAKHTSLSSPLYSPIHFWFF